MKVELIEDLYSGQIARLHDAERQQKTAMPALRSAATTGELRKALDLHIDQTLIQLERLEEIMCRLPGRPRGAESKAMRGIMAEAMEYVGSGLEPDLLEAALLGSLLSAESHEMACYSSAIALARQLGRCHEADTLKRSLHEESVMNDKLYALAEVLTSETAESEQLIR